jgi:hypothetical protein
LRVAIIGEGQTEYYCIPKIAGRCGHIVVGTALIRMVSSDFDWEKLFELRIVPLVMAMLTKSPDKIIIVLDREDRAECPGELAQRGLLVIQAKCSYYLGACGLAVVISNKTFECLLFADYALVDRLPILRAPVSHNFPPATEGKGVLSWIKGVLRPGAAYHKIRDGMYLAKHMEYERSEVQARSRSLLKLVRELGVVQTNN